MTQVFAGSGVVIENSSETQPCQSTSNYVTLTMISQQAQADFPTQIVSTSRGKRKHSMERVSANKPGGTITVSASTATNDLFVELFGVDDGAVEAGETLELVGHSSLESMR
jgi:hypothetical protein